MIVSFTKLLHQEATIHRYSTAAADRYGNAQPTYTADENTYACRIVEGSSTEDTLGRNSTVSTATGYFDTSADLDTLDRIEVDGEVWEIDGRPTLRHDAVGPHHYEASLRRIVP
jgi:hypothetical protein